jgi:hypothetical protein
VFFGPNRDETKGWAAAVFFDKKEGEERQLIFPSRFIDRPATTAGRKVAGG